MARFFIDRPVFAWVLAILTMLAGIMSLFNLPVSQYPTISPTTITISARYPGASAKTVEDSVTQVIEQNMTGLDYLRYLSSSSDAFGNATITLTFDSEADPDIAQVQVQNKLQLALTSLPMEVQSQGIVVNKSNTSFLMVVAVYSDDPDFTQNDIADFVVTNIQDPISRVTGVGQVQAFGSQYAMRVWLDPFKLTQFNLTAIDVANAISEQNAQVSSGQLGAAPAQKGQELSENFPDGLKVAYPFETTPFVEASIQEVVKTLLEAIVLVFLIMYLFLQNFRATIIPTIAVPVVLLGTFAILYATGFSVNTLTMFAMVLAIGLLVDDAIVVVENVERVMHEDGLDPKEATKKSMGQITGALIGVGLTLSAVFVPMAFMSGSTGVIYRQFSITIVAAMTLSVMVAIILTPALCATLLKKGDAEFTDKKGFFGWFNRKFDSMTAGYEAGVAKLLKRTGRMLLVFVAMSAGAGWLFMNLPTSFLPDEDQGTVFSMAILPPNSTQEQTEKTLDKVRSYFLEEEKDNVRSVFTVAGFSAEFRMQPEDFNSWYVRNAQGEMVPFSAFASGEWTYGSPQLQRFNGLAAMNIQGGAAPGVSTGEAMAEIEAMVEQLPEGFTVNWNGISYEERLSGNQAPMLYALSILVVFLVLAALYESWSVPLAVVLVVPLGVLGAVLAVLGRGMDNDVFFQVSLLTTVGLATKNAILIVEFAKEYYEKGAGLIEATLHAVRVRLRPIIMTSLAFGLGVVPLAISAGVGSAGQNAVGTGVLGGMISATLLGIFFVPVFFVVVERLFDRRAQKEAQKERSQELAPATEKSE